MKAFTRESLRKLQESIYLPDIMDDILQDQKSHLFFTHVCPFHTDFKDKEDKHTLIVTDKKYYCFECGASGDAVEFLMTNNDMTFVEAVETLAKMFSVELESSEPNFKRKSGIELNIPKERNKAKESIFEKIEQLLKELVE